MFEKFSGIIISSCAEACQGYNSATHMFRNVYTGRFKSMHCNLFSLRCSAVFHLQKFQEGQHQMWKTIQNPFTYQQVQVAVLDRKWTNSCPRSITQRQD